MGFGLHARTPASLATVVPAADPPCLAPLRRQEGQGHAATRIRTAGSMQAGAIAALLTSSSPAPKAAASADDTCNSVRLEVLRNLLRYISSKCPRVPSAMQVLFCASLVQV